MMAATADATNAMTTALRRLPSLDPLKGFVATARHASFTRAAEALHLSQSAVSRQVQTLENQLGVALFHRNTRHLALTPAGETLYACASALLAQLGDAIETLRHASQRPHVTVSCSIGVAALWLVPRLSAFQSLHPHIGIRVATDNRVVDLAGEGIDLSLRYSTADAVPAGSTRLFTEQLVPVLSPALAARLPHATTLDAANLPRLTLLAYQDGHRYTWLSWDAWLRQHGLPADAAQGQLEFNHYDQCIYAALAGQGVALGRLPLIQDLLDGGRLQTLGTPQPAPRQRGYFLVRGPQATSTAVDAFSAWLQSQALASSGAPPVAG